MRDGVNEKEREIAELRRENEQLRTRAIEAEEMLDAIRSGHVDALLIDDCIYTLESADAASNRFRGEVLAQVNDLVVAIDNDRNLTYINPTAERHYRVSSSEVLGRPVDDLVEIKWPGEAEQSSIEREIADHGFWRGESVHVRPDGTEFDAESTISVLRDSEGNVTGRLAVIRDVTERKRGEEALLRAREDLETRVIERTRELADANAALRNEVEARERTERHRTELLQRVVTTQEDERRRIARDIHDQLGQRVTALRLQLLSLTDGLSRESAADQLAMITETATRLDNEVGFLAYELRPASLDDFGLPETAKAFVKGWAENYGVDAQFSVRGLNESRLRPEVETHLYRIMQEALNNTAKHARARHVSVLLTREDDVAVLIIEDDGDGFNLDEVADRQDTFKGLGLLGMRERAALVGGSAQIESTPGHGTTIYVRVPA